MLPVHSTIERLVASVATGAQQEIFECITSELPLELKEPPRRIVTAARCNSIEANRGMNWPAGCFRNRGEFRTGDYEEIMNKGELSESAVERSPRMEHDQDRQYRWPTARSG